MTITQPGIYFDVPASIYHADPCQGPSLNQSIAKILLAQSPFHAWYQHPKLGKQKAPVPPDDEGSKRKATIIGNAAHKLILGRGPDVVEAKFKDWRTNASKELRDDPANADKIVLLSHWLEESKNIVQAVRSQLRDHQDSNCFTNGKSEVVIIWQEDGFWFRSMIDFMHSDSPTCDDLKTLSGSAAPEAIPHRMTEDGWPFQAAFQERGLYKLRADDAGRWQFRFCAVEQDPPCRLSVHRMSEAVMTLARRQVDVAIRTWKRCMLSGRWPSYSQQTQYPEVPSYKAAQWEAREAELLEGLGARVESA